jgi:hypothetical protein
MLFSWLAGEFWMVLRDAMSDKARAVIGLLFPKGRLCTIHARR